ncbi:MAG: hypothetical protein V4492_05585 [Chlamydiota bacterium]
MHNVETSEACRLIEKLFRVSPTWIEVEVSSQGLLPWEAAAAWIDQDKEGDAACRIQIRKRHWYPQAEVIAHEMVHALRAQFQEEQFEEVLAYQTSASSFRRYFGPLFAKPSETKALIITLVIPWALFIADLFWDFPWDLSPVFSLPCIALGWMGLRLMRKQRTFARCLEHLAASLPRPECALAVALYLTDDEIVLFSRSFSEEIARYACAQEKICPRWERLFTTFYADAQEKFPASSGT